MCCGLCVWDVCPVPCALYSNLIVPPLYLTSLSLTHTALVALEEAVSWKAALCDQLQRLVQEANKSRSERLQYITNTYFF
jgi:hypothetical protein